MKRAIAGGSEASNIPPRTRSAEGGAGVGACAMAGNAREIERAVRKLVRTRTLANPPYLQLARVRSRVASCLAAEDAFGNCCGISSSVLQASLFLSINRIERASFTSALGPFSDLG